MNLIKKILITGGAGFIGSHLSEALLSLGAKIYVIDNLSTGNLSNLNNCLKSVNFHFIEGDLCDGININETFDWICHFASPASPDAYRKDPIGTIRVNTEGTRIVLEYALRCGARVLLASTSEVYGDPKKHPQKEEYWGNVNSYGERACYDEGKRCAEAMCFSYQQMYNIPVQIIRIFNTYGPRMQNGDGRVICNFFEQIRRGEPITIYGDGKQTRSFLYIDDFLNAIISIISNNICTSPMNIGNPEEHTIIELAYKLCRLTNTPFNFRYVDKPKDDPSKRCPDIKFAQNVINWTPRITLEEGLIKMINL